jgi:PTH1 family peptidyl-tRNA hydrolase
MIVIVGLGNIGSQYDGTYHNLGFAVVDKLAEKLGIEIKKEKYKALIGEGRVNGEGVMLCKPTTYMNNSGEAVCLIKQKYKDARIIVAVDDIDLEKGVVRYREHGSAGTHNGLRSIVSYIGEDFERVKVGTGRDKSIDLADFVLSKIGKEEQKVLNESIEKASLMILEKIS